MKRLKTEHSQGKTSLNIFPDTSTSEINKINLPFLTTPRRRLTTLIPEKENKWLETGMDFRDTWTFLFTLVYDVKSKYVMKDAVELINLNKLISISDSPQKTGVNEIYIVV